MKTNELFVEDFLIMIIIRRVELQEDVDNEEESRSNVDKVVKLVLLQGFCNAVETQGQGDGDTVENGNQQNNDVPHELQAVVLSDEEVAHATKTFLLTFVLLDLRGGAVLGDELTIEVDLVLLSHEVYELLVLRLPRKGCHLLDFLASTDVDHFHLPVLFLFFLLELPHCSVLHLDLLETVVEGNCLCDLTLLLFTPIHFFFFIAGLHAFSLFAVSVVWVTIDNHIVALKHALLVRGLPL